jgi:hypothetical protein
VTLEKEHWRNPQIWMDFSICGGWRGTIKNRPKRIPFHIIKDYSLNRKYNQKGFSRSKNLLINDK